MGNQHDGKSIAFAYYHNGNFMGWRADTFNTISKGYPKVYLFSRDQVDTVLRNVRGGCNRAWQSLLATLQQGASVMTEGGTITEKNAVIEHVSKTDETFREWGEFEVRVHHISNKEDWYDLGEGEEWKSAQIMENLEPAIEIYKLRIVDNEN